MSIPVHFFSLLKKKMGIDRIHPHLCRHTFATAYVIGGGSLEMLRLLRGYSGHLYISVQRKNTVPAAPMSAKTVL